MSDGKHPYEVGYGRPPKHTQFVKGASGNPKGRPKGSKSFAAILNKNGRQLIEITENGRRRRITKFEAIALQLVNQGASGNLKAIRDLLRVVQQAEANQTGPDPLTELIAAMNRRSELLGPPEGRVPASRDKADPD